MRKRLAALVAVLAASWIVAPLPASSDDGSRSVARRYGCEQRLDAKGGYVQCRNVIRIATFAGESSAAVVLRDDSGARARARIGQDFDGDGELERKRSFCGQIEGFPIRPGVKVTVVVNQSAAAFDSDCGSNASGMAGKLRATFSR